MKLKYGTKKVEKLCTNLKKSRRELGSRTADVLFGLINLLESSESLEDVNALRIYKLHKLAGNRKNYYALDIDGRFSSYRLIIQPLDKNDTVIVNDKNLNLKLFYSSINIIKVEEVSNHYA
nr:type II toxin-antitoxin system RelE/ParE family toxin [Companilactobacillus kedongensis]